MSQETTENKKVTAEQKQIIIDYMQENHIYLVGKFGGVEGRVNKDEKWKEITNILNALGPPKKDAAKWKKCWADMKSEVKKKLQLQRQNRNQTGAGPINIRNGRTYGINNRKRCAGWRLFYHRNGFQFRR